MSNEPHRVWISDLPEVRHLSDDVIAERARQVEKWGIQHHCPEMWALILTEELGEWAQAILDLKVHVERGGTTPTCYDHMRDELVQVAAVALSALADLDGHADWRSTDHWPAIPVGEDGARWWTHPVRTVRDIGPFVRDFLVGEEGPELFRPPASGNVT